MSERLAAVLIIGGVLVAKAVLVAAYLGMPRAGSRALVTGAATIGLAGGTAWGFARGESPGAALMLGVLFGFLAGLLAAAALINVWIHDWSARRRAAKRGPAS